MAPVWYEAARSETTTQTLLRLPAAVSMLAKARVTTSATVPAPNCLVAYASKYGGISSSSNSVGSPPSNKASQSLSPGASGPFTQKRLKTSPRPSCFAISPQKNSSGLLRPLNAAMRAAPKASAPGTPGIKDLRRPACFASNPKPTKRCVFPPPIACLRWKIACVDLPARRAIASVTRVFIPCVMCVFSKNTRPAASSPINSSNCSI